jgi:hypothetical protein
MAFNPSIRKIPIIGNDIFKIGQVYDLINSPCDPDPMLWVYGFWQEVPMIFAMLLMPDPIDFVQERFGTPHHRKRRYRGKAAKLIPADISPGKGLGWAAWKMTEWVDRVGWYLLIADVAIDFALNWTTQVYQWAGCATPGQAYGIQYRNVGIEYGASGWVPATLDHQHMHIFRDGGQSAITIPADYAPAFTTMIKVTPRPPPYNAKNMAVRVVEMGTGQIIDMGKTKDTGQGYWAATGVWKGVDKKDYARTYQMQVSQNDGAFAWVTEARFAAYGTKKVEGLIPWIGAKPI